MTRLIDSRVVAIEPETAEALEYAGEALYRCGDKERGLRLLSLHLLWLEAAETKRLALDAIEPGSYRVGPVEPLRVIEGGAA